MTTPEQGRPAGRPGDLEPEAARLLALRAALRAVPVRTDVQLISGVLAAREERDRLRLFALRGVLVGWASALYPGVEPDALARAAASLDAVTDWSDAARAAFDQRGGTDYAEEALITYIKEDYDTARMAVRWVREALAEWPRVPLAVRDAFCTLVLRGLKETLQQLDWQRLQEDALEADRARLARDGGPAAVRELALEALWYDRRSAAAAAAFTFPDRSALARRPAPLGENALRWLEERTHGELVLGHAPQAEAERLVRIANLPESFWSAAPARDVGYALDEALVRELTSRHWDEARPFHPPPSGKTP